MEITLKIKVSPVDKMLSETFRDNGYKNNGLNLSMRIVFLIVNYHIKMKHFKNISLTEFHIITRFFFSLTLNIHTIIQLSLLFRVQIICIANI